MWTFVKSEELASGVLLFFTKGQMERNTIVEPIAVENKIQELIAQWEAEDAAQTTQEVE